MGSTLNVSTLIDAGPWRPRQIVWIFLCGLLAIFDGFDTQAIAFVAPVVARQLNLPPTEFGPIFAAGLVGLCIGAIGIGPLSDKFGRKPLLLASTLVVGVFALATAWADSYPKLLALRLLTGLGLGSAMPNILTLASEYAPKRHRGMVVTLISCGFPLGAVIGGLLSFNLIASFGWPAVFVFGGLLPLLAAPVIAVYLPESLVFLAVRRGINDQARHIIRLLASNLDLATISAITVNRDETHKARVSEILQGSTGLVTLSIWTIFFINVLIMYLLINWLPLVVQQAKLSPGTGILAAVVLNVGGIVGGLALGWLVDRLPPRLVISALYIAAAAATAGIGLFLQSGAAQLLPIVFFTGFFVIGAMFCMHSLVAMVYPTTLRSTGMGSALGVGRLGSVTGPLIGGFMLAGTFSLVQAFFVIAVPFLLCALLVVWLRNPAKEPAMAEGELI